MHQFFFLLKENNVKEDSSVKGLAATSAESLINEQKPSYIYKQCTKA